MTALEIGVIGGTGAQGKGLAYRFALAGHKVLIGSRKPENAQRTADEINDRLGVPAATGGGNLDVATRAELVQVAVPWDGHEDAIAAIAPALAGKIVVSCVNPLGFDKAGAYGLPMPESAAEQLQRLAPTARVVGAFHHVSARLLWHHDGPLRHDDILVAGNDAEAVEAVMVLAASVTGKVGIRAGALRLTHQLEPLTAVLININKYYKVNSGVSVSGLRVEV
ncbi:NADPH-dependent F420 reductase [Micromonospora sp. NPDC048830]|uniref:NADPH-dependent F420 reductase n=1 Tax=Micromonospora sp. NPDC048830 TaxID=3364257 RepID=UPI00371D7645